LSQNSTFNQNNKNIEHGIKINVIIEDYGVNITEEVTELNLNFSITSLSSGYILFNDIDSNVFDTQPLIGGESVSVIFMSDFSDIPLITKLYQISRVSIMPSDLKMTNNKNKFRIDIVSPLIYTNYTKKISKGYVKPSTVAEIVENILTEDLRVDKKLYSILSTTNVLENFIIPWSRPLDIIKQLINISNSSGNENDMFVFYEDFGRYLYLSLSELLRQPPRFKLDRENAKDIKNGIKLLNITDDVYVSGVDSLEVLRRKGIGETYSYFDTKKKKVVEEKFKLDDKFLNSITTLGNFSFFKKSICDISEMSDYTVIPKNNVFAKNYAYNNFRAQMFNMYRLKVQISGSLDVNVGETIYIEHIGDRTELNMWMSGTWIVTEVNLRYFQRDESTKAVGKAIFRTELIMSKDTYGDINKDTQANANLIKISTDINNKAFNKGGDNVL